MTEEKRLPPPLPARRPAAPAPRAAAPKPAVAAAPSRAATGQEKFTFFWKGPYSNWHLRSFEVDRIVYSCGEQWMMAEKARLFGDKAAERKIMASANPKEQKALGREVTPFDEDVWNANARAIVKRGRIAQFSQHPDMLEALLATEGTTLVEASPYDQIWGIGLRQTDPRALSRSTWRGTNWLGEVLTEVREELALRHVPGMGA